MQKDYSSWTATDIALKSEQMFQIGYVLAPVYVDFIEWALQQTTKPAYVLLRDGLPIYDIAQMLSDQPEFKPVLNWETKTLTRSMIYQFRRKNKEDVRNYLKLTGISDGTHVLIDTGVAGSMQNELKNDYDIDTESLFMFYEGDPDRPIRGYKNSKNYNTVRMQNDVECIFERLPKVQESGVFIQYSFFNPSNIFDIEFGHPAPDTEIRFYEYFKRGAKSYIAATRAVKHRATNAENANKVLSSKTTVNALRGALSKKIVERKDGLKVTYPKVSKKDKMQEIYVQLLNEHD